MKSNESQLYYFELIVVFFIFFVAQHGRASNAAAEIDINQGQDQNQISPTKPSAGDTNRIVIYENAIAIFPKSFQGFEGGAKVLFLVSVSALASPTLPHPLQPIGVRRMKAAGRIRVKQNLPLGQSSKSDTDCQISSFSTIRAVSHGSRYRIFIGILWLPTEVPVPA